MALSSMVLVLHTGTGYLEELLFKELQFKSAFFMVLFMCVLYIVGYLSYGAVVGGAVIPPVLTSGVQRGDRFSMGLLCCAYVGSNSLLNFVSVPTMIVFKSCKLVCVMFGATVIMGKVYTFLEYTIALGLVSGMISFSLADMRGSTPSLNDDSRTIFGIVVLLMALSFDAVLGNLQEKVQKAKICDEHSLMFVQSLASAGMLLVWTALTGELAEGVSHCWADSRVLFALCGWALSNMSGIIVMLQVVGEFSAVTAVVLSLVRKMVSLSVSYFFFPKALSAGHGIGLLLVFCSVTVHSFRRQLVHFLDKHKSEQSTGTCSTASPEPSNNHPMQILVHSDEEGGKSTSERGEKYNISQDRPLSSSPPANRWAWAWAAKRKSVNSAS